MIRQIVAIDSKRGIAKNGVQPWKIPADERYFQDQTKTRGGVVLMGRKTYTDVIHHPLADRQNFVLSRNPGLHLDGVSIVTDLQAFFAQHQDVWVIGGAAVYAQTFDLAEELYITKIEADLACDQFYPEYEDSFELVSQSVPYSQNGYSYSFCVYKRMR